MPGSFFLLRWWLDMLPRQDSNFLGSGYAIMSAPSSAHHLADSILHFLLSLSEVFALGSLAQNHTEYPHSRPLPIARSVRKGKITYNQGSPPLPLELRPMVSSSSLAPRPASFGGTPFCDLLTRGCLSFLCEDHLVPDILYLLLETSSSTKDLTRHLEKGLLR